MNPHDYNTGMRSPLADDAVAGISDPELRTIVADHWEQLMQWMPTWATTIGDHRYDDRLAPRDAASIEASDVERGALLARLRALGPLDDNDAVTAALLADRLASEIGLAVCHFHDWHVDSGGGSLVGELSYLVESHTVASAADAANVVSRMHHGARAIDDTIANLASGLAAGRVAGAEKLRRAIEQLDTELAQPVAKRAMASPAWASTYPVEHAALVNIVHGELTPRLLQLRDFLRDRVLPRGRVELEGLSGLPDSDACYRAAIAYHVGLAIAPAELHELGLREIARTDAAISALGNSALGTPDLASTIATLTTDTSLYFGSREEILATAQAALDRAKAATPRFFSKLPAIDCVMREIPAYEAPYSTIAYYRQPHYDGTKSGEYFVNTLAPATRPRFELEALTWHESIPGHHTQIALAMELGALPMFRRLDGSTAFVEGWALYTEWLAHEMGLYSTDLDRLGQASYDAWRASRLVVDTGLHALGWTRARAVAYMRAHTALTDTNISNEVDRYIGWPGQALAYKVGQLEIMKLRATAEREIGARFDLKAFHAVVLGAGAVTLPVLGARVAAWMKG
jgi:uncharacterized protein (DUF885 family)